MFITGRLLLGIGGVIVGAIGPVSLFEDKTRPEEQIQRKSGISGGTCLPKYVKWEMI
jgi:hypothetical protein